MLQRITILGVSIILLFIIMWVMRIIIYSSIESYYTKKNQADNQITELQSQVNFLNRQLSKPKDAQKADSIQKYDQKFGTSLQAELRHSFNSTLSSSNALDSVSSLRALRDYKRQQIQNIKDPSFYSYIPAWPILLLGVFGIIGTRIVNFIVDYIKDWICSYFKKNDLNED